jgi:hypothetical protein
MCQLSSCAMFGVIILLALTFMAAGAIVIVANLTDRCRDALETDLQGNVSSFAAAHTTTALAGGILVAIIAAALKNRRCG